VIGLPADAERTREIRRPNRQEVDPFDRGDFVDPLDCLHILDHAGEQDLVIGLRHMLDQRDPAELSRSAAGRHAAIALWRVADRLDRRLRSLGAADMRNLDALHPHVQEPQDEGGIKARRADDRSDPDALRGHHRQLHVVQIKSSVLHVDESGIEAGEPDQLDDLRIGDAADMRSQGEAALTQDPLDPVLFHVPSLWSSPPALGRPRRARTAQAGDDHVGIHDVAERIVEGGQRGVVLLPAQRGVAVADHDRAEVRHVGVARRAFATHISDGPGDQHGIDTAGAQPVGKIRGPRHEGAITVFLDDLVLRPHFELRPQLVS